MTQQEKEGMKQRYYDAARKAMDTWSLSNQIEVGAYVRVTAITANPKTIRMLKECLSFGIPLTENRDLPEGQIEFSVAAEKYD